jgi:hypothetical protein
MSYYAPRKISGEHNYSRRVVRPSVRPSIRPYVPNSCPAHKFVIWSRILQLLIETTWRVQHLGRYLEDQGHSMTLQQNRVRPITSLFEIGFYNYFTKMITILRRRVARNIWVATLKVSMTLQQNRVWPKTSLFEVGFYNYFIEIITILRQRVTRNIWVATL